MVRASDGNCPGIPVAEMRNMSRNSLPKYGARADSNRHGMRPSVSEPVHAIGAAEKVAIAAGVALLTPREEIKGTDLLDD